MAVEGIQRTMRMAAAACRQRHRRPESSFVCHLIQSDPIQSNPVSHATNQCDDPRLRLQHSSTAPLPAVLPIRPSSSQPCFDSARISLQLPVRCLSAACRHFDFAQWPHARTHARIRAELSPVLARSNPSDYLVKLTTTLSSNCNIIRNDSKTERGVVFSFHLLTVASRYPTYRLFFSGTRSTF